MFDGFVNVKTRYGTGRTCGQVVGAGQDNGRSEVFFGEAGSYDADDTFAPVFLVHNDALVVGQVGQPLDGLVGLFRDALVKSLAFLIVLIDFFAFLPGQLRIFGYQQFDRLHTTLDTTRSVDSWANLEDNVAHGEF